MPENVGYQILKLKLLKIILMLSLAPIDDLYPLTDEFKCPPLNNSNAFESSSNTLTTEGGMMSTK